MKFIKNLDYLSYSPTFYTQSSSRHKTYLGGITQILIILLYIGGISYFSQDIIFKNNPKIIEYTENDNNPPKRKLNLKDFKLAFAMTDPLKYTPYVDDSIYTFEAYQTTLINGELNQRLSLKTKICEEKDFEDLEKDSDNKIIEKGFNYTNYHCIDNSQDTFLKGVLSSYETSYIQIFIKTCNSTTSKCDDPEVIRKKLVGVSPYIFYTDKYFDLYNYEKPIKYNFRPYFVSASYEMFTFLHITLKSLNLMTDDGLFYDQTKVGNELKVSELRSMTDKRIYPHFLEILIMYSQEVTNYRRKYKRVQDAVSEIGGLMKIALFIKMIVNYYSKKSFFEYMSKKYFGEKLKDNEKFKNKNNDKNNQEKKNNFTHKSAQDAIHKLSDNSNKIPVNFNLIKKSDIKEFNNDFTTSLIFSDNLKNHSINKEKENCSVIERKSYKSNLKHSNSYQNILLKNNHEKNFINLIEMENLIYRFKELELLKKILFRENILDQFNQFIFSEESSFLLNNVGSKERNMDDCKWAINFDNKQFFCKKNYLDYENNEKQNILDNILENRLNYFFNYV